MASPGERAELFRRTAHARPATETAHVADNDDEELIEPAAGEYQAFRIGGRQQARLSFLPVKGAWAHGAYRYLLNVVEDGGHGTAFVVIFSFMAVTIRGRLLRPLISAIVRERCAFVQQFDAKKWGNALPDGVPVVTAIEICMEKSPAEMLAELERGE